MHYELIFWGMTAVVVTACVCGVAAGWLLRGAWPLVASLGGAGCVAVVVAGLTAAPQWTEGRALLVVASFMFSWVIASALALLTRRLRRNAVATLPETGA